MTITPHYGPLTAAQMDTVFNTVNNSNLSAESKITRSATLTIAASDSTTKGRAQADYVCTGTNDDIIIQTALNTLSSTGGTVLLLDGNFYLRQGIVIPVNTTLKGTGSSTTLSLQACISCLITVDATSSQANVTVSTPSLFKVGDRVAITDNNATLLYTRKNAETFTISSITGNVLSFSGSLLNTYTVAASATVYSCPSLITINNCVNVSIRDIVINGNKNSQANVHTLQVGSVGEDRLAQCGITAYKAYNIVISNVSIHDSSMHNISIDSSDCFALSNVTCTACHDKNILILNSKYGSVNLSICTSSANEDGIIGYTNVNNCTVTNCICNNNPRYGIYLSGQYNTITNCKSFNNNDGIVIQNGTSCIVSKNVSYSNAYSGITITSSSQADSFSQAVNNCSFLNMHGIICVRQNWVKISGNTCNSNTSHGLEIGLATNTDITNNTIYNNPVGINTDGSTTNANITTNSLSGNTTTIVSTVNSNSISRNKGYITEATGVCTLPANNTTVTVSHGMAGTPSKIFVTPFGNVGSCSISGQNSSTFVITASSTLSSDTNISWCAYI